MKPTSPEEREIEQASAEVSARYREAANDEPPARLDAAILQAARGEIARGRVRRHWRMPAAVAAIVVVGVSLSFMTKDVIDPLPPLEQKGGADASRNAPAPAEMAKPASPNLAMKSDAAPAARQKRDFGARPSRDRGDRADRDSGAREAGENAMADAAPEPGAPPPPAQVAAPTAQAPAASAPQAAPGGASREEEARVQEGAASDKLAEKKAAPAAQARRPGSLTKEEASGFVGPMPAEPWLRQIEALVAQGRETQAKAQLAEFRKRYPGYRLPEALRALEPAPADAPK
ncbi:MAG TPA: hypothetical protein VHA15_13795 [Burkholderiales bacterium]|nr:hypothetical protein [Burkholderiales bacterium]